ncbi:MAG: hypothetical protein J7L73_03015, partial [Anaerolineales bacterium]|nr:hypothetical protein [Anaerolineales bacterium]
MLRHFFSWLVKVLRKGLWLLGFLPTILDYLSTYIPAQYLPKPVSDFLAQGGIWRFTIFLVIIALLFSSYLVFKETDLLRKESSDILADLDASKPNITVGFQKENKDLTFDLIVQIPPLPSKPDIDATVSE